MQLRIPGPTPLPDEVIAAMSRQMISHRSAEFHELMREVTERLRHCFQTEGDVLVFPGAGTGGLEAAIVNLFSPGDTVIVVTVGAFGDRFADIAVSFGLDVVRVQGPWGQAADVAALQQVLERTPRVRGVLVTHNETSTGVQNDVQSIARTLTQYGRAPGAEDAPLLVVDAISSLGAVHLPVDEWGIDVAITASQKAWMAPPGLTMLSVSERAWAASRKARLPRFYWDFAEARRFLQRWETPYTPAVSLLYGLQASLRLIMDEGLPAVFARHERVRDYVRAGARRLGLPPFAADHVASRTVTALHVPPPLTARHITQAMRQHGVTIAGGQGAYEHSVIRIGHMGFVCEDDMDVVLAALRDVLASTTGAQAGAEPGARTGDDETGAGHRTGGLTQGQALPVRPVL
jgi:aspartate aminotransferase-like enzyme